MTVEHVRVGDAGRIACLEAEVRKLQADLDHSRATIDRLRMAVATQQTHLRSIATIATMMGSDDPVDV